MISEFLCPCCGQMHETDDQLDQSIDENFVWAFYVGHCPVYNKELTINATGVIVNLEVTVTIDPK